MAKKPKVEEKVLTPAEKAKKTKEAKKLKEEEDRRLDNLARDLKEYRESPLPPATYQFKEGEEARPKMANWKKVTVLKSLDEGKILLCKIEVTDNNYGKPYNYTKEIYCSHLELLGKNVKVSDKILNQRKQRPHDISFNNQFLDSLIHKHYRSKIDYNPEYQRGRVWTDEDKQLLIESIFNRIGIGSFAFVKRPFDMDVAPYEILDGKQRLLTIIDFYEDKFKFKGLTFSELSPQDKREFCSADVAVGYAGESMTLVEKYDYFLRLNTGGKPQSEEHLQKIRDKIAELKKSQK